jgi:hypothetical protein
MFMLGRGDTCQACKNVVAAHNKRHAELAEQLRRIYLICQVDLYIGPMAKVRDGPDETDAGRPVDGAGTAKSKKERKEAKKLARAARRPRVVTSEELIFLDGVLHPDRLNKGNDNGRFNVHEVEKPEHHPDYQEAYTDKDKSKGLRALSEPQNTEVDYECELVRILDAFHITELCKKSSGSNRQVQSKDTKSFERAVDLFKNLVREDFALVKRDEMDILERRNGYINYTSKSSYEITQKRMNAKDNAIGLETSKSENLSQQTANENIPHSQAVASPDIRHLHFESRRLGPDARTVDRDVSSSTPTHSNSLNPLMFKLVGNTFNRSSRPPCPQVEAEEGNDHHDIEKKEDLEENQDGGVQSPSSNVNLNSNEPPGRIKPPSPPPDHAQFCTPYGCISPSPPPSLAVTTTDKVTDWNAYTQQFLTDTLTSAAEGNHCICHCPFFAAGFLDCQFDTKCLPTDRTEDLVAVIYPTLSKPLVTRICNRLYGERLLSLFYKDPLTTGRMMLVENDLLPFLQQYPPSAHPASTLLSDDDEEEGTDPADADLLIQRKDARLQMKNFGNDPVTRPQMIQYVHMAADNNERPVPSRTMLKEMQKAFEPRGLERICYCQSPVDWPGGKGTVCCSGKDCTIKTFHRYCVREFYPHTVTRWYCPSCMKLMKATAEEMNKTLGPNDLMKALKI